MYQSRLKAALEKADIRINGSRPWDITIHNPRFFNRILRGGITALGESYVDSWWDCDALDEFFHRCLKHSIPSLFSAHPATLGIYLKEKLFNLQELSLARSNVEHHYNLGNDLFESMLDTRLTYTCAYWKDAKNLNEAQEAKLDLVCKKIGLKKGMSLLDIGCGWGSLVIFAAQNYGARCLGITLSQNQVDYVQKASRGLPVDVKLVDYRTINQKFDRIVSLGMFEHVGYKNYRTYMESVHRSLKDDGLFLLHSFGSNYPSPNLKQPETRWVEKYIFPNTCLPSLGQLFSSSDSLFTVEDVHNFGAYYDPTLMAWHSNFVRNWPKIKTHYDSRFYRMWCYYLLLCAAAFRSRNYQLWQIVYAKKGKPGVYRAVR